MIEYKLLGSFAVEADGRPVDVGGPKQRAVLALLLLNANHPLSPETMIDQLWGEHPPETALATLQAYISNLRRMLQPDRPARNPDSIITKSGGGYQINVDADAVDAIRFDRLLTAAASLAADDPERSRGLLVDALQLWRGPALADFRYHDFARTDITRLEEMRTTALELRIAAELALGTGEELIAEIETLLAKYPLRERLWGHLMVALYRSGRQAEALRAFRRCEETLGEELGIVPGEALRRLELAILNHDPALDAPAPRAPSTTTPTTTSVLIGRHDERTLFQAALNAAWELRGSVLVFEGEAGIGKTRLLETLAADAAAAGARTAFARCVEIGGTAPFWPWIQLVRQLDVDELAGAAGRYAPHLAALLPDGAVAKPASSHPAHRMVEGLSAAFAAMGARQPIVLFIDDLYSADPDSLSLLSLLGAEIEREGVVVVVTHRGEDVGVQQSLAACLSELQRLSWVRRRALDRLDLAETAQLVATIATSDVDDDTMHTIYQRTEGNAFFAVELTRLLEAEQQLSHESAATLVPSTVLEVMSRRLQQLDEHALRLVRAAAVHGREFEVAVIAEALGFELHTSISAIDQAVANGLIQETPHPGRYRFSHMIVLNAVTKALGAVRCAHLHGLIADALERRYGDNPQHLADLAHHRVMSVPVCGPIPAIDALARAACHALASSALELAENLLDQRLDMVMTLPPTSERNRREIEALLDLARVWTWREGYHSDRLATTSDRFWELMGADAGSLEFDPDEPITSTNPVLSALQMRFGFESVSGNLVAAAEVVEVLRDISERTEDALVAFTAAIDACVVGVHHGDVEESLEAVRRGAAALRILDPRETDSLMLPMNQQSGRVTHHSFAGWAYWLAGERKRARQELAMSRRMCDRSGHGFTKAFAVTVEGLVGAMDNSPEWVADTIDWGRTADGERFGLVQMWADMQEAWSQGMLGTDPQGAASVLREILGVLESNGAPVVSSLYWGLAAQLELRSGDPRAALDALDHGLRRSMTSGENFWYPELERLASRAHAQLGAASEAAAASVRGEAVARRLGIKPLIARFRGSMLPS